jgi:hypothetical protein
MTKLDNNIKWTIITIFVLLYVITSSISTIHVIEFFKLSNPDWLGISLAIAFEIGAAACLGAIIILEKTAKWLVWSLFIIITLVQMMGNVYFAYVHVHDYQSWIELFGLSEEEPIFQKRVLSITSGAILPIVALGFIKSLVDYIKPSKVAEMKAEHEEKREEKLEIEKEIIEDFVPENATPEQIEEIEEAKEEIAEIEEDQSLSAKEKSRKMEERIAKIIASNPEIKKQIGEKLKETEDEDKYNKIESSDESPKFVKRGAM